MDSLGEKEEENEIEKPSVQRARHSSLPAATKPAGPREAPPSISVTNPHDEHFPKSMRVHSRREFDDLFRSGKVIVDNVLVVHGRASQSRGRIGISISKRVGNSPFRNRWKRLIREVYRRLASRSPALARLDLVVRPRRGAVPTYAAIERSLSNLINRLDRQINRDEKELGP